MTGIGMEEVYQSAQECNQVTEQNSSCWMKMCKELSQKCNSDIASCFTGTYGITRTDYSCPWEDNYKIDNPSVCEWVMASCH